jgi:small subunit ribosomal protein S3
MIERKFVNQNIKEFEIKEYIRNNLSRVGLSDVKLQRTPLGEKIVISTSRPGLVVGRSGTNITKLTQDLKHVFKLENPQIEIEEVASIGLDPNIIAEMIANSLEKFGIARFKGIGHKAMADVMNAGAFGVEILIGGKVPSTRAKTWRFYQGYLKKCGDIAVSQIKVAYASAQLKSGTIGIKVSIMTPDTELPDRMYLIKADEDVAVKIEEVKDAAVKKELEEKAKDMEKEKASDKPAEKTQKQKNSRKEKEPRKKSEPREQQKKQAEAKEEVTSSDAALQNEDES